jgi:hypothetical protein
VSTAPFTVRFTYHWTNQVPDTKSFGAGELQDGVADRSRDRAGQKSAPRLMTGRQDLEDDEEQSHVDGDGQDDPDDAGRPRHVGHQRDDQGCHRAETEGGGDGDEGSQ